MTLDLSAQEPASLLKAIQVAAKAVEREYARLAKRAPPTPKSAEKDAVQRREIKQQIDRGLHELHCLVVELGIATPQPERYGEKRLSAGFGRQTLELRRTPRGLDRGENFGQSEDGVHLLGLHSESEALDLDVIDPEDGRMSDKFRCLIEGMSVSVDVSTGEDDAGHRLFGSVCEVMDDPQSKHGVTLLIHDAEPNFVAMAVPRSVPETETSCTAQGVCSRPYDANHIAWELERTALGEAHYGNALRVAKDMMCVNEGDRSLLERYATGSQGGTDHVELQSLAIKIRTSAKETWHE